MSYTTFKSKSNFDRFMDGFSYSLISFLFLTFIFLGLYLLWDLVIEYFHSAPAINGAIAVIFLISIFLAFWSTVHENYWTIKIQNTLNEDDDAVGSFSHIEKLAFIHRFTTGKSVNMQHLYKRISDKQKFSLNDFEVSLGYAYGSAEVVLKYLPTAMVTLGLIGTFLGLSETVSALSSLLSGLAGNGDGATMIAEMMAGLPKAISGMGVAFHTSLYGVSSSLFAGVMFLFYQRSSTSCIEKVRSLSEEHNLILEDAPSVAADTLVTVSQDLKNTMTDFRGAVLDSVGELVDARNQQVDMLKQTAQNAHASQERLLDYFQQHAETSQTANQHLTQVCTEISQSVAQANQTYQTTLGKVAESAETIEAKATELAQSVQSVSNDLLPKFVENGQQEFAETRSKMDTLISKIDDVINSQSKGQEATQLTQQQVLTHFDDLKSNIADLKQSIPDNQSDQIAKELQGIDMALQDILNTGYSHFPTLEENLKHINLSLQELKKEVYQKSIKTPSQTTPKNQAPKKQTDAPNNQVNNQRDTFYSAITKFFTK